MIELLLRERRDDICLGGLGCAITTCVVGRGNLAMMKLLLDAGANPSAYNALPDDASALHWQTCELVGSMMEAANDDDPWCAANVKRQEAMLRELINRGADYEYRCIGACSSGDFKVPAGTIPYSARDVIGNCSDAAVRTRAYAVFDDAIATSTGTVVPAVRAELESDL